MLQNGASDQCWHSLLTGISMQNTVKVKIHQKPPKTRNELIQMIGWTSTFVEKGLIAKSSS